MKSALTTTSSMAATFLTGALLCLPAIAMADVSKRVPSPTFTIVNNSGKSVSEAQFYYLGVGTNQSTNQFLVLMSDGSWRAAGAGTANGRTQWNKNGFNPSGPKNNQLGAGVVPCHKLVPTKVNGVTRNPTVTLPPNLVGARIYFFMVTPGQTNWFDNKASNGDFTNKCNALPASKGTNQANGIFGNVFTPKGGAMPFSYFSTKGSGGYNGASPADILQNSLPLYTFSEAAGPQPTKKTRGVGDIDASQVDLVSFPTNIIAQIDPNAVAAGASVPTGEGVGFSFSPNGEVNNKSVISSFTDFAQSLSSTDAPDYAKLRVSAPNNGGEFLVNPGNYLSYISPSGTEFGNHFLTLINDYLWNANLNNNAGWTGRIDIGGKFKVKGFPRSVPQLVMTGRAVNVTGAIPGYTGTLSAIQFTATVNNQTFVAYVWSPVSYQSLCESKIIKSCPANLSPAYQIFAGDGALSATGTDQFSLLSYLSPNAPQVWAEYDSVGGSKIYNMIVARLGEIISNAFNRGVAGGLPNGLCAASKYLNNISYCWSDQANWYPNGPNVNPLDFYQGDITQNQFARWLHTNKIARTGGGKPIPIMTQPTNPIPTKSGDVMGMAYGFGYDENPTPQLPGATPQQTPSEYSSNVLYGSASSPIKNCITIMPYDAGIVNPTPPASSCVP